MHASSWGVPTVASSAIVVGAYFVWWSLAKCYPNENRFFVRLKRAWDENLLASGEEDARIFGVGIGFIITGAFALYAIF